MNRIAITKYLLDLVTSCQSPNFRLLKIRVLCRNVSALHIKKGGVNAFMSLIMRC
jgi:hypothetical protein